MKTKKSLIIIVFLAALACLGAVRPRYGGEISLRLNEPTSFSPSSSTYSNLLFYSLIYENFFYLHQDGSLTSNIFSSYRYDAEKMTLMLVLKENLSYSNGKPISAESIKTSLRVFLNLNLHQARRLSRALDSIHSSENIVTIKLNFNLPDILSLLSSPDLILVAEGEGIYSGPFFPEQWLKGESITLQANPFYPGGRSHLDTVRVYFDEKARDLFLSDPGLPSNQFQELPADVYQNIYLSFPHPGGSLNTRIAIYTLLRRFQKRISNRYLLLNSLTSDDESPVSIKVNELPENRINPILRQSNLKLHIHSALKEFEKELTSFLKTQQSRIDLVFFNLDDFQTMGEIDDSISYLVISRTFRRDTPPADKLSRIISELSFRRFDEKYLKMINELSEMKYMADEALLLEQSARIVEEIVRDGFLLPLFQKRFSLYARRGLQNLKLDYYGRPLLFRSHLEHE